jgi:hypothetical protein
LSDTPRSAQGLFATLPGRPRLEVSHRRIRRRHRPAQKLGLFIEGVDNGRSKDHNLSLIVGNQSTGRWMKASPFENPWILADQLANTLQNWKQPSIEESYANAPGHSSAEQWRRTVPHPLRLVP